MKRLQNIARYLREQIYSSVTFQPIRELLAILGIISMLMGFCRLSNQQLSESYFWSGLILAVLAEAYARDI